MKLRAFVLIGDGFSRRKLFNHPVPNLTPPTCFLFDNGSLRPKSTLALRRVAQQLEERIHHPVRPVSLLHADRVPANDLAGQPAELLEAALQQFAADGGQRAVALPLFFGPSGAMVDYLPPRLTDLRQQAPQLDVKLAAALASPEDDSAAILATALREQCQSALRGSGFRRPLVLVCDHGSPLPTVTAVRNRIGAVLAGSLTDPFAGSAVCSMERREGAAFAFNEPLLATALREGYEAGHREVIVALQFLFAGRHAGRGGDVATICREAEAACAGLHTYLTEPIGESGAVLTLLERRWRSALSSWSSTR